MRHIASSESNFYLTTDNLSEVFLNIAGKMSKAATSAKVTDPMGYDTTIGYNFTVYVDETHPVTASQGVATVAADLKSISWDLGDNGTGGDVTETASTLTYYIKLNVDPGKVVEPSQLLDTNEDASVVYKNYLAKWCGQYFPLPKLTTGSGTINVKYYLVNTSGQPINSSGNVVSYANRVLVATEDTFAVEVNTSITVAEYAKTIDGHINQSTTAKDENGNNVPTTLNVTRKPIYLNFPYYIANTYNESHVYGGEIATNYSINEIREFGASINSVKHDKVGYTLSAITVTPLNLGTIDLMAGSVTGTMPAEDVTVVYTYTANGQKYTVNYLEKGTDKVLEEAVTKDAKFAQVITGASEAIAITGYTYDSVDPASLTIGTNNDSNVINVYYTANGQKYTVNHYLLGTTPSLYLSEIKDAKFGDVIDGVDEVITILGYVYVSADPVKLTIDTDNDANIINVYYTNETIEIPVAKTWIDGYKEPQYYNNLISLNSTPVQRPESIILDLVDEDGHVAATITLPDENGYWSGKFIVPKYDENSNVINYFNYTVEEEPLDDYIYVVDSWLTEEDFSDGFGVYNIEAIKVPVTKEWQGPSEEIIITLLNEKGESTGYTLTLNKENGWEDYFKLPKYVFDEEEMDWYEVDYSGYTINESEVEGYSPEITGNVNEGFNIVNNLNEVTYTVNYLDYDTGLSVAPRITRLGIYYDKITEHAIDVNGYNKVGQIEKTITLGSGDNVINFYYSQGQILQSDFFEVNWLYETGYNTKDYNERYSLDGEGSL
ncbi:MAG: Cna B-type domain-containing protein, partial [Tissierellia bacterium]|nr:Cna B-type domain-containing protein [Tissierellia bacterium]